MLYLPHGSDPPDDALLLASSTHSGGGEGGGDAGISAPAASLSPSPHQPHQQHQHRGGGHWHGGGSRASIGHQSFAAYTERSAPSLDRQPNAAERGAEGEMGALLEALVARLQSAEEIEIARDNVDSRPRLDLNPYRPPRGAHLRAEIQDMQVAEWGALPGAGLSLRGEAMRVYRGEERELQRRNSGAALMAAAEVAKRSGGGGGFSHAGATTAAAAAAVARQCRLTLSDVTPLAFATDGADSVLSITGRAVPRPPMGHYARVSAFGGIEEVTVAAHGGAAAEEEPLGMGGQHQQHRLQQLHHQQQHVQLHEECDEAERHREARRAQLGLPPIEPRAAIADEAAALVFQRLWAGVVVPRLLQRLGLPPPRVQVPASPSPRPAQSSPCHSPTPHGAEVDAAEGDPARDGRPQSHPVPPERADHSGRIGRSGVEHEAAGAEPRRSQSSHTRHTRHGSAGGGIGANAKRRSASARRFVSMYIEEQHKMRQRSEGVERVPTPDIARSPATPGGGATAVAVGAAVPLPPAPLMRRPSLPAYSDNDDDAGSSSHHLNSGGGGEESARDSVGDGDARSVGSSAQGGRKAVHVRAHTAKPAVKPRLVANGTK